MAASTPASATTPTATCGSACHCSPAASPASAPTFLAPNGQLLTHAEAVKRGLVIRTACECCRDRKLKCDGRSAEHGGCLRCERSGVPCHYAARDPIGRPRKRPLAADIKPRKRKSKQESPADAAVFPPAAAPAVPTPPTEESHSATWSPGWSETGPSAAPPAPAPASAPAPALLQGNMSWPPLFPGPHVLPPVPQQRDDPQGTSPPASLSDLGLAAFLRSLDVLQIERSDLVRLGQDLAAPSVGPPAAAVSAAGDGEASKAAHAVPTSLQSNTAVLGVQTEPSLVPLLPMDQTNMPWPYPLPPVNSVNTPYSEWTNDLDPERLFAGSAILDPRIAYAVPADFSWWDPGDLSSFPANPASGSSESHTGNGMTTTNPDAKRNESTNRHEDGNTIRDVDRNADESGSGNSNVNENGNGTGNGNRDGNGIQDGMGHAISHEHSHPSPPGASPASCTPSSPSSVVATPISSGVHYPPGSLLKGGKTSCCANRSTSCVTSTASPPNTSSCCTKSKTDSGVTAAPENKSCCPKPQPIERSSCHSLSQGAHQAQPAQVKSCCAKPASGHADAESKACCIRKNANSLSMPSCSGCATRDQAAAIGALAAATAAARHSPSCARVKAEPLSPGPGCGAGLRGRERDHAHARGHDHRHDRELAHHRGDRHEQGRKVYCVPNPHGPGCTCLCDAGVALISIERNVATASEAPLPSGSLARSVQLTLHTSQAVSERCACSASCPTCRSSPTAQTSATLLISTALQIYAKAVQTLRTGVGGALGLGLGREGPAAAGDLALDVKIGDWRPSDVNARKIALFAMKLELRDLRAALGRVAQVASSASVGTSHTNQNQSLNPTSSPMTDSSFNIASLSAPAHELEPEKRLSIHAVDQLVIRKLHLQLGEILAAVENLEKD